MPVFAIVIVISLAFYLFYKTKYFRSKKPMERQWISAKSSIALGLFVISFALNQLFSTHTTLAIVINIILLLVGSGSIWVGIRAYKHYLPLAINEANQQ